MEKVKLALNYALMIEMIRAQEPENEKIIGLLDDGNVELLERFGEGIPTWSTMVDFYQDHNLKCQQAIKEGYEITFLTKGALKSLLSIKFEMKEGQDFVDTGECLDHVRLSKENLEALRSVLSMNWTIVEDGEHQYIKIEQTYKPVFNLIK